MNNPCEHSAMFIIKPYRKTSTESLSKFVKEEDPAAYNEIKALEYHKRMTRLVLSKGIMSCSALPQKGFFFDIPRHCDLWINLASHC